jgi:fibronectin type 3 domain-containing protein
MQIMHLSLKHRSPRQPLNLLPFIFLLCLALTGSVLAAEKDSTAPPCLKVTITLAPNLRTTIFNRVAVLPLQADTPQLTAELSDSFYSALLKTNKYELLPAAVVTDWLKTTRDQPTETEPQQQAVILGRTVKARGVIYGSLLSQGEEHPLKNSGSIGSLAFRIQMLDAQTGKTCWTLRIVCRGKKEKSPLNKAQLRRIMQESLQQLIRAMVADGDIFSTRLIKPTVISTRGELRKVRVILQPDPPYIYTAYQLLSAEEPDGVFTARTAPVNNDHAPIILEDPDLKDGKSYFYTVIGLTKTGLANVPAPPFTVTTSGAPSPLDTLQASGNNLRHIRLLWPPSQDPNVTGYTIYRSTAPTGPFERVADINDRDQQSFIDYGTGRTKNYGNLADDTLYFYTIRTKNRFAVESKDSPVVSARTKGAPLPPTEVQAIEKQAKKIPLLWTPAEDPDIRGYAIFRSESEQGPFHQIDFVRGRETQEYTDTGSRNTPLANNTTYFYRLRSVNMVDLSSEDSATVSATTKAAPGAVYDLRVTSNLFRRVELQWPPAPENDIIAYEIFRGETEDNLRRIATVNAPATSYLDSGLRDGSTYWYQVRAIDSDRLKGDLFPPISATTKRN